MNDFKATFSNLTSSCLFLVRFCYDYIMGIIDTVLLIFISYSSHSASGFLSFTSNISMFSGFVSMFLSFYTPDIKKKIGDNSFFGYITPIVFTVLCTLFFACIFYGYGYYACCVGVVLLATVKPLRYTFYNSFVNSTWAASSDDVKSLQGFNGTFSARPAKWLAALMMMIFAVTVSASSNMLVLAVSIAISTVIWIIAVYYTPKNKFEDKEEDPKKPETQGYKFFGWNIEHKHVYWSVIATLAIVISTFLHLLKDIISAKLIGVALLPAIRFWIALPVVMVFYTACRVIKNCYLENNDYFGVTIILFGAIFIVFAVLFPYSGMLQGFAIASFVPNTAALMLQNWFFIAFSMFCEMWTPIITGTIVYPIQNEYFNEDEIFTVIPKMTILQSLGEMLAGFAMKIMSIYQLPITTIVTLVIVFVVAGISVMTYFHNVMYSSGCIKSKYLFQDEMKGIVKLRYTCRNNLIGLLCFVAGVTAIFYGFNIGAAALMVLAAGSFMSDRITKVKDQYYEMPDNSIKANEVKPESCAFGKGVNYINNASNGCHSIVSKTV